MRRARRSSRSSRASSASAATSGRETRLLDEAASPRWRLSARRARASTSSADALRRSSGDPASARPLFESAYALALEERQHFVAADAAHMVALAARDRDDFLDWTRRGVELAELHDAASYWLGPLLNNLGWEYYEAGDLEPALDAFERALLARERDPSNAVAVEIARYAVGKTLRGARPLRRGDPTPRAGGCLDGTRGCAGRLVPRGARRGVRRGRPSGRRAPAGEARGAAARARRRVVHAG